MAKKKSDIKTASAYFEVSFLVPISHKKTSEIVYLLKHTFDKVDVLNKTLNPLKLGVMAHGIYYSDGMLDHEINKLESIIMKTLNPNNRIGRTFSISKRKVFMI